MNISSSSLQKLSFDVSGNITLTDLSTNIIISPISSLTAYTIILPDNPVQVSCIIVLVTGASPTAQVVVKNSAGSTLYQYKYYNETSLTPEVTNNLKITYGVSYAFAASGNYNGLDLLPYSTFLPKAQSSGLGLTAAGYLYFKQNVVVIDDSYGQEYTINELNGNDVYCVTGIGITLHLLNYDDSSRGKVFTVKNLSTSDIILNSITGVVFDFNLDSSLTIQPGKQISLTYCGMVNYYDSFGVLHKVYFACVLNNNLGVLNTQKIFTIPVNATSIESYIDLPVEALSSNLWYFMDSNLNDPAKTLTEYKYAIHIPPSGTYEAHTIYYVFVNLSEPTAVVSLNTFVGTTIHHLPLSSSPGVYAVVIMSDGSIYQATFGNTLITNWESERATWDNIFIPDTVVDPNPYVLDAYPFVVSLTNGDGVNIPLTESYSNWLKTQMIYTLYNVFNPSNPTNFPPINSNIYQLQSYLTNSTLTAQAVDYAVADVSSGEYTVRNFRRYRTLLVKTNSSTGYIQATKQYTLQNGDIGNAFSVMVSGQQMAKIIIPAPSAFTLPVTGISYYQAATTTYIFFGTNEPRNTQLLINGKITYCTSHTLRLYTDGTIWYSNCDMVRVYQDATVPLTFDKTSFGKAYNLGVVPGFSFSNIIAPSLTSIFESNAVDNGYVTNSIQVYVNKTPIYDHLTPTISSYVNVFTAGTKALFFKLNSPILIQNGSATTYSTSINNPYLQDQNRFYLFGYITYLPLNRSYTSFVVANTSIGGGQRAYLVYLQDETPVFTYVSNISGLWETEVLWRGASEDLAQGFAARNVNTNSLAVFNRAGTFISGLSSYYKDLITSVAATGYLQISGSNIFYISYDPNFNQGSPQFYRTLNGAEQYGMEMISNKLIFSVFDEKPGSSVIISAATIVGVALQPRTAGYAVNSGFIPVNNHLWFTDMIRAELTGGNSICFISSHDQSMATGHNYIVNYARSSGGIALIYPDPYAGTNYRRAIYAFRPFNRSCDTVIMYAGSVTGPYATGFNFLDVDVFPSSIASYYVYGSTAIDSLTFNPIYNFNGRVTGLWLHDTANPSVCVIYSSYTSTAFTLPSIWNGMALINKSLNEVTFGLLNNRIYIINLLEHSVMTTPVDLPLTNGFDLKSDGSIVTVEGYILSDYRLMGGNLLIEYKYAGVNAPTVIGRTVSQGG